LDFANHRSIWCPLAVRLNSKLFSAEATMRMTRGPAVFLAVSFLMLAGCGRKASDESSRSESAKPQVRQEEPQTTSQGATLAAWRLSSWEQGLGLGLVPIFETNG
jgi:hypothetical protein